MALVDTSWEKMYPADIFTARHGKTEAELEQLLPAYLPYWMCVQSSLYQQLWINTSKRQTVFFLLVDPRDKKVTRILMWLTWMYHVVHNTCTMHGRYIKTRYFGLISILRFGKDWHSIRLDRMPLSFKKHFQIIVVRKLWHWRLEKS